jgi:predicted membrane channel-forming protein YqfA (hemolysin III family)
MYTQQQRTISVNLKYVCKMLDHISIYTKIIASLRSRETCLMEKQRALRLTLVPQLKNVACKVLKDFY